MAKKRIERVNEQIRRELTSLLQRDVRDPRIGIVTVTDVETSPDLYHAKVFYSVLGSDEDRDSAAEGLRAAAGFLRTEIGRRMHIRRAPELHFSYDDTLKHAMHIERLLREVRASDAQIAGESLDMDPPENARNIDGLDNDSDTGASPDPSSESVEPRDGEHDRG